MAGWLVAILGECMASDVAVRFTTHVLPVPPQLGTPATHTVTTVSSTKSSRSSTACGSVSCVPQRCVVLTVRVLLGDGLDRVRVLLGDGLDRVRVPR